MSDNYSAKVYPKDAKTWGSRIYTGTLEACKSAIIDFWRKRNMRGSFINNIQFVVDSNDPEYRGFVQGLIEAKDK